MMRVEDLVFLPRLQALFTGESPAGMSSVTLPVNRPMGRALVVGNPGARTQPVEVLRRMYGFDCVEVDDPYAAMLELCRRKAVYNAVIVSLVSVLREELDMIATVKRRFPHLEIWLTHSDGRPAMLAEALQLGADGLLGEDGLHRTAPMPATVAPQAPLYAQPVEEPAPAETESGIEARADEMTIGEPVLTADELRALLQDQPTMPPAAPSDQSHG
jgi:hypothetical protein